MPSSGVSRYPYYVQPAVPKPYSPTLPTQPPVTQYAPPPPPPAYTLPPPPALPTIPQAPPNPFIGNLSQIFSQLQSAQPYAQLSPEILAMLGQSKTAALAGLDQYAKTAQGSLLGNLFGSNMQRSSSAIDRANTLSTQLGTARAGIEADAANRQLAAQQYAGQFGQQGLGMAANVATSGAGLNQNAYRDQINAMLGLGGLAQQGYASQTGNILQQQGLSQNYQIQQQQMQQQLLQQILSMIQTGGGAFGGGGGAFSGFSGSTAPASGVGGAGAAAGITPYGASPSQDPQQQLFDLLLRYLQGVLG